MTQDYLDDLTHACEDEGCAYVLAVQDSKGKFVNVRYRVKNWKPVNGRSFREDFDQLLEETVYRG